MMMKSPRSGFKSLSNVLDDSPAMLNESMSQSSLPDFDRVRLEDVHEQGGFRYVTWEPSAVY